MKHTTYIIGCGGGGSWLVPVLTRLNDKVQHRLHLFDGDVFEERNLDRQMFDRNSLGRNKAAVLAAMHGTDYTPEYLSPGWLDDELLEGDYVIVCADNNAARRTALAVCDRARAHCIIAANEYTDAEAYYYHPDWKGTPDDPRVRYPLILTDDMDDPVRAGAGCTGEAATLASPQLVIANVQSAVFAAELYWFVTQYNTEFPQETWPVAHKKNQFRYTTQRKQA